MAIRLNDYLKETFGCKVYKLAIDGGFTCPNRDGTLSDKGCIFCSGYGSGDFAESSNLSITEQIEKAKERVSKKITSGKYIAYFQAFTNTYAPVDELRKKYLEAINHPDIVAISIATRPDCLPKDVLDLLNEMNNTKPVWVELGLQTIHPKTAKYIRREYELPIYDSAVKTLKQLGINVITHVILGLPGETEQMMLDTVSYVGNIGSDGIKLQLLHVIKGTGLEADYLDGKFKCLEMDEYISLIKKSIDLLPDNMVIHRMTGDGAKKTLVAPLWSANKKVVINAINKALYC